MSQKMHVDEREIDADLVQRLLKHQFPHWADLSLHRVEPGGTVNAIFRLGDQLSVRLARRDGPTQPGGNAFMWLPQLAPRLPLDIPVPVAQGRPSREYPWFWDIHTWVEGSAASVSAIDAVAVARDLADFVRALQQTTLAGGTPGRGIPLIDRDADFRYWLDRFDGNPAVSDVWEEALNAPPWDGPPIWHHGDLDVRNWLVRDGRLTGIIDWDEMGVGDPACDVMVAWKLHSAVARDAFRQALPTDDATWARARGWVVSQAVAILAYYTPENNPVLYHEAQEWLNLALSGGP
jgi:aminoglycoside phosphotransferase (APT) family kinase protein